MTGDEWIIVPNWDKFQHYKNRNPPWIKLYTSLNSNGDWLNLSYAQRGVLVTIWLEYARSGGRLKVRQIVRQMYTQIGARYTVDGALKSLSDAGFIELSASNSREEKRREEKSRGNHAVDNLAATLAASLGSPAFDKPVAHATNPKSTTKPEPEYQTLLRDSRIP